MIHMNNYPKIKYAFFDLDGTLNDSASGIMRCFRLGLASAGLSEPDDEKLRSRVIGPPLLYSYKNFYGMDEETAKEAVRIYRADYTVRGYKEGRIYDGVTELLQALNDAGIICALVTSKPEVIAKDVVAFNGLDRYFAEVVGPSYQYDDASKATLMRTAMQRLNVTDASCVLMAGDRNYDIEGAKETGAFAVGVLWGFGSREELENAGADMLAESPADILKVMNIA